MKVHKGMVIGFCLAAAMISCASSSQAWQPVDEAVGHNDFAGGVDALTRGQEAKKPIYTKNNAVSLYLDKGLIEHYSGNYAASSESLREADRLIREAETKSVTQNAASFIANDNTKDYPGEDYENIYLNVFNALNYYHQGKLEDALVEIRVLTESSGKLGMLADKYQADNGKLTEALGPVSKAASGVSGVDYSAPVDFADSALAHYLSALFYRGQGKSDDARIEFDKIAQAYAASKSVYKNPLPGSIEDERVIPEGKARLNVVGFSGLSPIKEGEAVPMTVSGTADSVSRAVSGEKHKKGELYLMPAQAKALTAAQATTTALVKILPVVYTPKVPFPWLFMGVYTEMLSPKLRVPILAARPAAIDKIAVRVEGGPSFELELLEDMGAAVEQTFNARFGSTLLKTSVRTMVKYTAAFIAARAVQESKQDTFGEIAAVLTLGGAQKVAEASEVPDIRGARYFPAKAYAGGVTLDPGTYTVTVDYYSGGRLAASGKKEQITVKANSLNLIEGVCLR